MFCIYCGNKIDEDSAFCTGCGKNLKEEPSKSEIKFCSNCGCQLEEEAIFCTSCGNKIFEDNNEVSENFAVEMENTIHKNAQEKEGKEDIIEAESIEKDEVEKEISCENTTIENANTETNQISDNLHMVNNNIEEPYSGVERVKVDNENTKSDIKGSQSRIDSNIDLSENKINSNINEKQTKEAFNKLKVSIILIALISVSIVGFIFFRNLHEKQVEQQRLEALLEQERQEIPMIEVIGGTLKTGGGYHSDMPEGVENVSSFLIGKTEVTQKQWEILFDNHSFFKGDDYPVDSVTWYEAVAYCNWLSEHYGRTPCYSLNGDTNTSNWKGGDWDLIECNFYADGYRLPTEAEWEFAARGGMNHSPFRCSGSDKVDEVCWYFDNSKRTTHPVALKLPNILGIYDMSGNVEEWCWDGHRFAGDNSLVRRCRGGSYSSYLIWSSSFYVDCRGGEGVDPSMEYKGRGFRLVRTMHSTSQ